MSDSTTTNSTTTTNTVTSLKIINSVIKKLVDEGFALLLADQQTYLLLSQPAWLQDVFFDMLTYFGGRVMTGGVDGKQLKFIIPTGGLLDEKGVRAIVDDVNATLSKYNDAQFIVFRTWIKLVNLTDRNPLDAGKLMPFSVSAKDVQQQLEQEQRVQQETLGSFISSLVDKAAAESNSDNSDSDNDNGAKPAEPAGCGKCDNCKMRAALLKIINDKKD